MAAGGNPRVDLPNEHHRLNHETGRKRDGFGATVAGSVLGGTADTGQTSEGPARAAPGAEALTDDNYGGGGEVETQVPGKAPMRRFDSDPSLVLRL